MQLLLLIFTFFLYIDDFIFAFMKQDFDLLLKKNLTLNQKRSYEVTKVGAGGISPVRTARSSFKSSIKVYAFESIKLLLSYRVDCSGKLSLFLIAFYWGDEPPLNWD